MKPRIEYYQRRTLAGLSFFGDPFHTNAGWTEDNEIGRLWKRLDSYLSLPECPYTRPRVFYELHLHNHETPITGGFEVFIGFEVTEAQDVPIVLCAKILPGSEYAIFTIRADQMSSDESIVDDWVASSGYEMAYPLGIQRYDERFLGLDRLSESELDCLIPIRRVDRDERT